MFVYFWVAAMLLLPFVCLYQIEEATKTHVGTEERTLETC